MKGRGVCAGFVALLFAPFPALFPSHAQVEEIEGGTMHAVVRQLVDVDDAGKERLDAAKRLAGEKKYDEAVRELHELMKHGGERGFVAATNDTGLFVSAADAAARLLSALPDEALDVYVRRFGKVADDLYADRPSPESDDALRRIAETYFHTSAGGQAAARLAALAFDRGDFLEAATGWLRLHDEHRGMAAARHGLLAKACAAYHAAGQTNRAAALRNRAAALYPKGTIPVAGESVSISAFLDRMLAKPPVQAFEPPRPANAWTSMAGSPCGVAVSPDCGFSSFAVWNRADSEPGPIRDGGRFRAPMPSAPGLPPRIVDLEPRVHPIVTGNMVICRTESAVVATALDSGAVMWQASDVPLYLNGTPGARATENPLAALAGDMGRQALCADGQLLFTVCKFSRFDQASYHSPGSKGPTDSSSLVAMCMNRDGARALWEVGNGNGPGEIERKTKYLAAPTCVDGRLYLLVRRDSRYHAMCLAADTGERVWDTPIGWVPLRGGALLSWQQAYVLEVVTERGGPVAVCGGTVFLTTNTGLVVALRARDGRPLWARQYPSRVSGAKADATEMSAHGQLLWYASLTQALMPVNPLVVARGRVICLPCDSPDVFALDACTGAVLWRRPREKQRNLAAIGETRLLVSGPDALVLDAANGAVVRRAQQNILGRPLVTTRSAIASGLASLALLDLTNLNVSTAPVADGGAFLGNLASAGGILLSANAGGLSAFASFDITWPALGQSRDRVSDARARAELSARMGLVAVDADRLNEAETSLAEAGRSDARSPRLAALRAALRAAWLRRAGNAADRAVADAAVRRASELATNDIERLQARVAGVGIVERFDNPAKAIEAAQAVSESPEGNAPGATYVRIEGRREVARLIRRHGDAVYAEFDRAAERAFSELADGKDLESLLAVHRRWPHSLKGGEALIAAADALFRKAVAASPPDADLASEASRLLARACNSARADVGVKAYAALATIEMRFRPRAANALRGVLAKAPPSTSLAFAGFTGTVGDVLARMDRTRAGPMPAQDARFTGRSLPERPVYASPHAGRILRDTNGEPVRLGDCTFLWGNNRLMCLDSRLDDFTAAAVWSVELRPTDNAVPLAGELSPDGTRLAVMDSAVLHSFDTATGSRLLRETLPLPEVFGTSRLQAHGDWLAIAADDGTLTSVRTADGRTAWRISIPKLARDVRVRDEILLARTPDMAYCMDIRTGRSLTSFQTRGPNGRGESFVLTPDGMAMCVTTGNTVSVRDVRSGVGGEVAIGAKPAGTDWRFVGVGSRYAGLVANGSGAIVLDMAAPDRPIGLDPRRQTIRMAFLGDRALLLCADPTKEGLLSAPAVVCFGLPAGGQVWERELVPADAGPCRVQSLDAFGNSLSVSVLPSGSGRGARRFVLCAADGSVTELPPRPFSGTGNAGFDALAVVMNGRILAEYDEGILCLGNDE